MLMPPQTTYPIDDSSQIGNARRAAADLAALLAFDPTQAGRLALAINETGTNILKHAGRGRLLLRSIEHAGIGGVELIALDKGPGIADLETSLRDGYSTRGTLGGGLGALSRVASNFQIYTQPGKGTALRMELWSRPIPAREDAVELGGVCLAKPRESVSGDAWAVEFSRAGVTALVADGLGHGSDAHDAARLATDQLAAHPHSEPLELLEICHAALARTRGAAVAVAKLIAPAGRGSYASVGNIVCRVEHAPGSRQLVSYNGIVGHTMRKTQELAFPWPERALLILHSDGLGTQWDLAAYPGLAARHPALIAAVLYRDYDRGRDDVTVVVLRNRGTAPRQGLVTGP
ncbi:MAG TPA: ATP-binding protein [Steroidobacteraceae bacterium]|nr:ATP-binding protein [Steroidobacteraceae bacterium]